MAQGDRVLGGARSQRRPVLARAKAPGDCLSFVAVRAADGSGELAVPAYELFSSTEVLGQMAMARMLGGLSTRRYQLGLEPVGAEVTASSSATSRSAVSRKFVAMTETALAELLRADLSELDLVAFMVDGVYFAEHLCVVALGIDISGGKHPLAVAEGSTENATVVRDLIVDLRERGLDVTKPILAVLDGSKALRRAVLAVFDKPDPLDGPYFEETIYVTPSRLEPDQQGSIAETTAAATTALGLLEGPIHAELRINEGGMTVLEVAPRSIGGLCARTLRFGAGISLEELILRHAAGLAMPDHRLDPRAAGVMMLPIRRAGRLESVKGQEAARRVPEIEDLIVTVPPGERLVPLPEGDRYLGFLFARGRRPSTVEAALRDAYSRLTVVTHD